MNYADIKIADVANGKGVRVSLFVSGCTHHCKGCFNPQAWDFCYGKQFTEEDMDRIINELDHPYVAGLSILGGEPLEHQNQQGLLPLLKKVKERFPEKDIWIYTGDVIENIVLRSDLSSKLKSDILEKCDYLVDGPFIKEQYDPDLEFRGSSNQRIINLKEWFEK